MKRALLFLFILVAFPSLTQASLPNRKGKLERTSVIKFSDKQITTLKKILFDDKGDYINKNFPKAYRYISSQLTNMNSPVDEQIFGLIRPIILMSLLTSILCISHTPYLMSMSDVPGLIKSLRSVKNLPDVVRLPIIEGVSEIDAFLGRTLKAVD